MNIIETDEDVATGAAALAAADPRLAAALAASGTLALRRRGQGFAALFQTIVGQQVSTASAANTWARIEAAGFDDEAAVRRAAEADLRGVGLSGPKIRYARALAAARLDYARLGALPEPEAVAALTAVTGVGRWTAEMYLMFAVGRADVFAPGDLALREAARALYELRERPSITALDAMSEAWRPWRSVAARILFAYYRAVKGREGAL